MARFGINSQGVDSLNQLAKDMVDINKNISENSKKLKTTISNLGEDLGEYEDKILDLVTSINRSQEKGGESVEILSEKLKKTAEDLSRLINAGL